MATVKRGGGMQKLIKDAFPIVAVALCLLIILAGCRKNPEAIKVPVEKIIFACAMHPRALSLFK